MTRTDTRRSSPTVEKMFVLVYKTSRGHWCLFLLREDKLLSVLWKISGIYFVCRVTVRKFSVTE
jgi:hypothetical protein